MNKNPCSYLQWVSAARLGPGAHQQRGHDVLSGTTEGRVEAEKKRLKVWIKIKNQEYMKKKKTINLNLLEHAKKNINRCILTCDLTVSSLDCSPQTQGTVRGVQDRNLSSSLVSWSSWSSTGARDLYCPGSRPKKSRE